MLLTARHRLGTRRASFLHDSELAIQLPGVPVDSTPFLDLCRYTGNEWAQFEYIARRLTFQRRLKTPIALDAVGVVVSTLGRGRAEDRLERVITGVIAQNPFFPGRSLPVELQCDESAALEGFSDTSLLLCSVRDWHDEGDVVDRYMLEGFEVTSAHRQHLIRPFGTWNRIIADARSTARNGRART